MKYAFNLPLTALETVEYRDLAQTLDGEGFDLATMGGHLLTAATGRYPDRPTPNYAGNYAEPFVLFAPFGPAALEFEIRVFLADVLNGNIVQNDIRFAVIEAFAAEGIDIPSTPRAEVKKPDERWPPDEEPVTAMRSAR